MSCLQQESERIGFSRMRLLSNRNALVALIMLASLSISLVTVKAADSDDERYAARKVIWAYTDAMNQKSVENILASYTDDGKFVDEYFNDIFFGRDQLRNLYRNIFERNPRLTFTAFPWNIELFTGEAFVTCSWSLVADYGVYNGIYYVSMRKVAGEWKIAQITAHITGVHYYNPPYYLLP